MSSYNFDFSFVRSGAPIVTLSSIGLAFNSGARSLLGYPNQVDIGFDERLNIIAVRPHDPSGNYPAYEFETREKNGWVRLSMRDFMKYLSLRTNIDFLTKSRQFLPEVDDETGMLLIVVDNEHLKDKVRT